MPNLQVRDLPENIYNQIKELAEKERRSITQQTIVLLEKALEIERENKERRKKLLDQLVETDEEIKGDIPDPVPLIREDRER